MCDDVPQNIYVLENAQFLENSSKQEESSYV